MKRYLVFAGEECYGRWGWNDFCMDADSVELCVQYLRDNQKNSHFYPPSEPTTGSYLPPCALEWWQIVDMQVGKIIMSGNNEDITNLNS